MNGSNTMIADYLVRLVEADIDTDQIVPARYLKTATRQGLGKVLFADRRCLANGDLDPEFPLNPPGYKGQSILLAGANFGCGSSREHAAWAFKDFGIRAILAPSFAEIFYNNCLRNGLALVTLDTRTFTQLASFHDKVVIDLLSLQLAAGAIRYPFKLDPFARYCLMHDLDALDHITQQEASIAAFEAKHYPKTQARGPRAQDNPFSI